MSLRKRAFVSILGLIAGAVTAPQGYGQEGEASPAKLQEVIVTAQRREENIQTVPVAVTAVSMQSLQNNNVVSVTDLQYLVPSLSMVSVLYSPDAVNVSIRGQGSSNVGGPPGVASYLNDIPIPVYASGELAGGPGFFFDLENVQVLKGPQGTLFGKNSVGGALLLQTARPTNQFGGQVQLGYGNHNNIESGAVLNIPIISDKLLTRIAYSGNWRDGYSHLLGSPSHPNGIDLNDRNYWSVRDTVTFRPNDSFQNDFIATYQKYWDRGSPFVITKVYPTGLLPSISPEYLAAAQQQVLLGARTVVPSNVDPLSRGTFLSLGNITRADLSDTLTFRNIFGFNRTTAVYTNDRDSTVAGLFDQPFLPYSQTIKQFTEEAQIQGKSFGGKLNWIAGGFYLDANTPSYEVKVEKIFSALRYTKSKTTDNQSKALFAQGTYDLSNLVEGLGITGGVRYTWDQVARESLSGAPDDSTPTVCGAVDVNCSYYTKQLAKFHALTSTVNVSYQATPDTLVYFATRSGYRQGGFNATPLAPSLPSYDPEHVRDFELGAKSDWTLAGIPVRTNAALYYQNYTDIQLQTIVVDSVTGIPTTLIANSGKARIWGAELEAQFRPTENLDLSVSFDHLDFKLLEAASGVTAAQLLSQLGPNGTGVRPPYKYGFKAHYNLPLGPQLGRVSLSGSWNWQAAAGAPEIYVGGRIPAFGLLNLNINWDGIYNSPVDASFFVSNATNKLYRLGGLSADYIGYNDAYRFGEPRMYGVRLRYRFGDEK